jgi:hypothetical protein
MPASTLSRRSVALLRVNLGQLHFGRPINFTRKLHKNRYFAPFLILSLLSAPAIPLDAQFISPGKTMPWIVLQCVSLHI